MKYQIWTYDVWGNDVDGFEVNNKFRDIIIDIPKPVINGSDKILIDYLTKEQIIIPGINYNDISIDGDEDTLYFDLKGKPEFELELVK